MATVILHLYHLGGGFLIYINRKWHLRGILNLGLLDKSTESCDLYNYSLFLDIVKYVTWIAKRQGGKRQSLTVSAPVFFEHGCGDGPRSPAKELTELNKESQEWFLKIIRDNGYMHDFAVLITPKFVLARASNMFWYRESNTKLFVKKVWCRRGCKTGEVVQKLFHEDYKPKTEDNNILLLKLKEDFLYNASSFALYRELRI